MTKMLDSLRVVVEDHIRQAHKAKKEAKIETLEKILMMKQEFKGMIDKAKLVAQVELELRQIRATQSLQTNKQHQLDQLTKDNEEIERENDYLSA